MGWGAEAEAAAPSEPALRVVDANEQPEPVVMRAATAATLLLALKADGWRRVHRLRLMGVRWTVTRLFDGVAVTLSCRRTPNGLTMLVLVSTSAVLRWLRLWLSERGFVGCAIVVESPEDRFPWMSVAVAASAIALFVWIVALR